MLEADPSYPRCNKGITRTLIREFPQLRPSLATPPAFSFKRGDERSATGSHYTPDDLVQPLIKHSLDHLIAERLKEKDPAAALLELRVAGPLGRLGGTIAGTAMLLIAFVLMFYREANVVVSDAPPPDTITTAPAVRR